jgi:hypothetical protein
MSPSKRLSPSRGPLNPHEIHAPFCARHIRPRTLGLAAPPPHTQSSAHLTSSVNLTKLATEILNGSSRRHLPAPLLPREPQLPGDHMEVSLRKPASSNHPVSTLDHASHSPHTRSRHERPRTQSRGARTHGPPPGALSASVRFMPRPALRRTRPPTRDPTGYRGNPPPNALLSSSSRKHHNPRTT